jgi:hypothetical protein
MLLELMRLKNGLILVREILKPFFCSMHSFYQVFWCSWIWFSWKITERPHATQEEVFQMLQNCLVSSASLIEPPYREVICEFCRNGSTTAQITFINNIIIYKPAKLYFKYSRLFIGCRKQTNALLNYLHPLKNKDEWNDFFIRLVVAHSKSSYIFTTPILIDAAKMIHLPVLFSEYDLSNLSKVVSQMEPLWSDTLNRGRLWLRGSIFRPFFIDVYPNNQLLNAENLVILDEISISKNMRFFGAQELLEYGSYYTRGCGSKAKRRLITI